MCSIVGLYDKTTKKQLSKEFFSDSFHFMKSRGPDNQSHIELDKYCSLGHQRLSIIDVGNQANQPMTFGQYTIVFNGEIYNYIELKDELKSKNIKFETTSDTEVLIKGIILEDLSFLNKVNGMFAFALYNSDSKELILARDRYGVKPLHYMIQDEVIYFSSEIKPLINIKNNKKINIDVYKNFFEHMATDYNEETFVRDIYQVKKGHHITINESFEEKQWYFGNDFIFDESIFEDKDKTLQFVEDTILSAIEFRMRADVPICLTLSGGVDSTTIYTLIKERLNKEIKLFTFIHPNSETNEYAKVIKLVSSYDDFVCTIQSENTNSFDELKEDLDVVEFPIWGISTRAYRDMYDSINRSGFKVVIEGHGADEELGGYPYMVESAFYDYLKSFNFSKALKILRLEHDTGHSGLGNKSNISKKFIRLILRYLFNRKEIKLFQENIDWTFDFKILPIVLRAFDRLSMGSSIESRSPFMDYRVVELFKKLPIEYKINEIGNKSILREILKKYKKTYIFEDKQKMGFASDIPSFFNNIDNKKMSRDYIEKFNMIEFKAHQRKALEIICKEKIEWADAFEMSKVLTISMINEKYQF